MKKIKTILIALLCILTLCSAVYADEINSPYYGVYNAENMELLIGENTQEKISIASITKIMTAIVTIDNIQNVNDKITIDMENIYGKVDEDLVTAGLLDEETLTYYDLLATMLVPSGADSAVYLQNIVFGDENVFIEKMNEKAQEIGMYNTHFSNVTGLDDENNYSTIEDVAKMMNYARNNQTLKEIMSLKTYTTSDGNITVKSTISNLSTKAGITTHLILGGKTGTTGDAGICLASFSRDEKEDVDLIAVVTGTNMYSSTPYNVIDSEKLYEEVITHYIYRPIVLKDELLVRLPTHLAKEDVIEIHAKEDIKKYLANVDYNKIDIIYEGEEVIEYNTKVGTKLGTITYYYDSKEVGSIDVILEEELHLDIVKWAKEHKKELVIGVVVFLSLIVIALLFTKKKSKR